MIKTLNKLFRKPMEKTILIIFMFFLTSVLFGQSQPKYENVKDCVLNSITSEDIMNYESEELYEKYKEECGQSKTEHEEKMNEFSKLLNEWEIDDDDDDDFNSYNFSSYELNCTNYDGEKHCHVKGIYPDGRKYEGEFKDGNPNGQGEESYPDGGKYIGEWKDGKFHGEGILETPDGITYLGGWKDGVRHGKGQQDRSWESIEANSKETGTEIRRGEWKKGKLYNGESLFQMFRIDEKGETKENRMEIYKEGKVDEDKSYRSIVTKTIGLKFQRD